MKVARVLMFVVIGVGLLGFGPSANTQPPKETKPEISQLQTKVEQLEKLLVDQIVAFRQQSVEKDATILNLDLKILDLAKKVNDIEQRQLIDAMEHRPKVPSNWVPRTINGMTYYIVPCDEKPRN